MKNGRFFLILSVLILGLACSRFAPAAPSATVVPSDFIQRGSSENTFPINGITRHYRLYVPKGYQSSSPVALVLNIHGLGTNSIEEEALSGMSPKAEKEGFIVAYPDGIDHAWNDGTGAKARDDLLFISDLIQALKSRYNIDPKRIYATGISNGGGMTNRIACDLSDVVAAVGPVSGAYNLWKDCKPNRPVPVITFHGTADKIVPFEGIGGGNLVPPILDWAAGWAQRNHCDPTPKVVQEKPDVKVTTWGNCQENASVILYAIDNHGHSWPGSHYLKEITSQSVNATDVMWEFFKAHPMP